eukprot:5218923-Pyramimonas_sp.AAC.1
MAMVVCAPEERLNMSEHSFFVRRGPVAAGPSRGPVAAEPRGPHRVLSGRLQRPWSPVGFRR